MMRRVLIPLDGGSTATEIFPDAIRVAGPNGELLLMHVVSSPMMDVGTGGYAGRTAVQGSEQYLQSQAELPRSEGATVRTLSVVAQNISAAIEKAVVKHDVDLIACTTHGRTPAGRLAHGAVVWKLLAHATVPLLIRHVDDRAGTAPSGSRRILVPLDGSAYAEEALPLARSAGSTFDEADALCQLGGARRLTGDYPAAIAYERQALDLFRRLGDRLGPVLLQLPPDLRADPAALEACLGEFARFPGPGDRVRVAVERLEDRLRQAAGLAAESGAGWADGYRPGSPGCHELLDRAALLSDMLERHLLSHPACVANPGWYMLAEQAAAALRELYQQVGAEHLGAEGTSRPGAAEVPA